MLSVQFDSKKLNMTLKNINQYSYGFIEGIEDQKTKFYKELAIFTEQALYKYIDSMARMHPESLHHVYEWNKVGDSSSRLFNFNNKISGNIIMFNGKFLPSSSTTPNSNDTFKNKAYVMENQISVTISPKQSDFLAFEIDGEKVFTTNSVFVEHPGGDSVAHAFGKTIDDFFSNYFTNAMLFPLIQDLSTADEYKKYFKQGSETGKMMGKKAGRQYMSVNIMEIE